MKKSYSITLAVSGSILVLYWLWIFVSKASPEGLANRALNSAELKARVQAAVTLSMMKSPDPTPQLRRLLKESKDPEVLAQGFNALAFRMDQESVPEFIKALEHETAKVRQAAYAGVLRFNGGSLPEELEYSADASAEERAFVAHRLRDIHEKGSQGVAVVVAAEPKAPAPSPSPAPLAKEPPGKETPPANEPAPQSPGTVAPAPVVYAPPPSGPAAEYPAITLLVWMLQIIAVLVLVVVVAGAISLVLGEKKAGSPTGKKDNEVPAAADKNSVAAWIKIALLIAGAVCMVALLTTAEMVRLAVRVEQKIDNMSRTR